MGFFDRENAEANPESLNNRRLKNGTADDRKINEMMNEVASELNVSENRDQSPEEAKKLGRRMEEEIKKRT
ncbi:hypothetical protein [Melghirimyces algeriensis]|uniref:Uncharacterized protein n=1 Tax=Melghirimyces algeriensis TaxID=910412 RepID=A0A521BRN5_9BACL|nr:hypothetical protein [Melghirimyces algeriensis]SMO49200.1 hypothetical protein SAMN06264849_102289 [Melghirimyces algeriensis]